MKKMTIRTSVEIMVGFVPFLQYFERVELITLFNIGADVHTRVCRIRIKKDMSIENIPYNRIISNLIILNRDGRDYTCFINGEFPDEINWFIHAVDLKLEYPVIVESGRCTLTLIGSAEELHEVINAAIKKKWETEILAVEEYNPHISGIFNIFTGKQKEILLAAYQAGYFEYPRRIDAGRLAKKMGMHKTTLLEHIHKAENRLMGHIIEHTAR
jgi:Predicted DNA binding protein